MINVLVFPAGTEIGLEVAEAVKHSKDITLFGASSVIDHAAMVYKNYTSDFPSLDHPLFHNFATSKLIDYIIDNKIDVVYPTHDLFIDFCARTPMLNLNKIFNIVTHPKETVEVTRSKKLTYKMFPEISPEIQKDGDMKIFPVFSKPDAGFGSKGCRLFYSKKTYEKIGGNIDLEYLPGSEFTVDCFSDKNGNLLYVNSRSRDRIKDGISVKSKLKCLPELQRYANLITKRLKFTGAWFFQVKRDIDSLPKLLEIAPRIGGTSGINRIQGVNLPLLSIYTAMGIPVSLNHANIEATVDRALCSRYKLDIQYDRVYVDLDDTLIVKDKVNKELLAFIYQCRERYIPVILLTRNWHAASIKKHFAISEDLFTTTIILDRETKKSKFIGPLGSRPILIDDSFSERKEVRESTGIYTFDVNDVAALLDWKH